MLQKFIDSTEAGFFEGQKKNLSGKLDFIAECSDFQGEKTNYNIFLPKYL